MSVQQRSATVVVRLARLDDAATIADLHVRSWRAAYRGIVPDAILDGLSIEQRVEFWQRRIRREADPAAEGRVWVVVDGDRVVGLAASRRATDPDLGQGTGELAAIYLAPEAWSKGLGSVLFAAAIDDLRARGFAPLVLWVIEANARGRRFYERAGWRPDGARHEIDFDGTPVDEIRYCIG